ncbi:MAG: FGGY-family carbohydrate kinase [Flavisolibacter sp.]
MPLPVIAIFDIGKTNKKLILFDENYQPVWEYITKIEQIKDEDGYPCENIFELEAFIQENIGKILQNNSFQIEAINFTTYGASLVYLDLNNKVLTPLYNYLKPYPQQLENSLYENYGGVTNFCCQTASPALGSLNSGLQFYRIKKQKPSVYEKIHQVLHFPQYLSFLFTGKAACEMTSIGCHTHLWDFKHCRYHDWVIKEGLDTFFPPIINTSSAFEARIKGQKLWVGVGIHDSAAALIPYQNSFIEPFVLVSTGSWCISLNPFNNTPITPKELEADCLLYMTYRGSPVKAARFNGGFLHERGLQKLTEYFNLSPSFFNNIKYDSTIIEHFKKLMIEQDFFSTQLSQYSKPEQAYHHLIFQLVRRQIDCLNLVNGEKAPTRNFIDGGFSQNNVFMNLLAAILPEKHFFAANMPQASSLGAALALHHFWNIKEVSRSMIEATYYPFQKPLYLF